MLIEIIGEWAIVFVREDDRFFCMGTLIALNLFLSINANSFLGMALAMHFPPLYYLVDYKKLDYASA